MNKEKIEKRFPADMNMSYETFLNDKAIDALLYAVLLDLSKPYDDGVGGKETRVSKYDMPLQKEMCERSRIKDTRTYKKHFQRLIDKGYLLDEGPYYTIPKKENWFLDIPLTTIKFFLDVLKDDVFKTYIYLGQKWNWSNRIGRGMPIFTKSELLEHIGLKKNQSTLQFINNVLVVLKDIGVIDYREFHEGKVPQMRLIAFDLFVKNLEYPSQRN